MRPTLAADGGGGLDGDDGVEVPLRIGTFRAMTTGARFWAPSGYDVRTTLTRLGQAAGRHGGDVRSEPDGSFRLVFHQELSNPMRPGHQASPMASIEIEGRISPWGHGTLVEGRIRRQAAVTVGLLVLLGILTAIAVMLGSMMGTPGLSGDDDLVSPGMFVPVGVVALFAVVVLIQHAMQCRAALRVVPEAVATYLRRLPAPAQPTGAAARAATATPQPAPDPSIPPAWEPHTRGFGASRSRSRR